MYKLFEGQIPASGTRDVLEAIAKKYAHVKNGVLRITAEEVSGLAGIFCGRYITGAVISASGKTGHPALEALLSVPGGFFTFLDAGDDGLLDLKQLLNVDIELVISGHTLSASVADESLTGNAGDAREINTVDKSDKPKQTYDKLLTIQKMKKTAEMNVQQKPVAQQLSQQSELLDSVFTSGSQETVQPTEPFVEHTPMSVLEQPDLDEIARMRPGSKYLAEDQLPGKPLRKSGIYRMKVGAMVQKTPPQTRNLLLMALLVIIAVVIAYFVLQAKP